ncbi:O-methyltransferase [Frankia sp. AiPs1]|uniref:thiopeptide-type bacteriocin biosynthesis protein n=1 Tax=Frankia sp. AiPa1 TaxID=573492 RepID=UPI00202ACF51|nr:thiopeptide-type bacteriocin biosynthesis protein [Frankia sp. AiPa1]MCL9760405.1 thiopeptide-type bacteriocin biosynthesis protein [Frankia sp. AiPa1]
MTSLRGPTQAPTNDGPPHGPCDDAGTAWRQLNLRLTDYTQPDAAGRALGSALARAQDEGTLVTWWFIRKAPHWRLRLLPAPTTDNTATDAMIGILDLLREHGHLTGHTQAIYEAETQAFGGPIAMDVAHQLFHEDSRYLLTHQPVSAARTRALSVLACTTLMRAAGQDWYEQGDVWARVAAHRAFPDNLSDQRRALEPHLHQLLTADTGTRFPLASDDQPLAHWLDAFTKTGRTLGTMAQDGALDRGLRAILAHHILFHWNRSGLPSHTQALLAHTAKAAIFA